MLIFRKHPPEYWIIYTLRRCACVRKRALRDASRPLPALACAADDLERTRFFASADHAENQR
eukprot:4895085-Pleurochrysis_carterae.AAC.1